MKRFLVTVLVLLFLVVIPVAAQEARWKQLQSRAKTFLDQRKYKEGLPLAREAHQEAERTFGAEHLNVAASLYILAELHRRSETCRQAIPLHQRALAIREKAHGPEHPDVAQSLDSLGWTFRCLAQPETAKPLHERALAIREKALGPNDSLLADSLWTVAGYSNRLSPLYERAMAIWERTLDPKSPEMAKRLWQMAHEYSSFGRRADAEPLLRRSLAIQEELPNPEPQLLADTLGAVGGFYLQDPSDAEKTKQGLALQMRALEIEEKIRDRETNEFALRLGSLASLHERLKRSIEAEALYQRMLDVELERLGSAHLHLVESYRQVASFYSRLGTFERAEPLYKRSLVILEKELAEPEYVAVVLDEYAELLGKMNRPEDAKNTAERAQAIRRGREDAQSEELFREVAAELETLKPGDVRHEHKNAVELLRGYVRLLQRTNRTAQATKLAKLLDEINAQADLNEKYLPEEYRVKDMIQMAQEQFGPEHPVVASFLEEYAVILRKMNREPEAKQAEERAKRIRAKHALKQPPKKQ